MHNLYFLICLLSIVFQGVLMEHMFAKKYGFNLMTTAQNSCIFLSFMHIFVIFMYCVPRFGMADG